jgi:hypothetical protein
MRLDIDTLMVKVPRCVNTEDESIAILFAFIRRIMLEYSLDGEWIDIYGSDIRKILDRMDDNIHDYLLQHVNTDECMIVKLSREHFVFKLKNWRRNVNPVPIKQHKNITRWAYLMGCTNYNLLEKDGLNLDDKKRPHYTGMFRYDRDLFIFGKDDLYE